MNGLGIDFEQERKNHLPEGFTRFDFTSSRKKITTILENINDNEHGYDKRCHMKGAFEILIRSCTKFLGSDGEVFELDNLKQ
jgi:magnesium-transporting ATPase (P-type)